MLEIKSKLNASKRAIAKILKAASASAIIETL